MNNIPNFIVWYKLPSNDFRVYNYCTKELTTESVLAKFVMNQFEYITKSIQDKTDEKLIEYSNDLIRWRNELIGSQFLKVPFDYFDNSLVMPIGENVHIFEDDDGNQTQKRGRIFYRNHSNNIKTFVKKFIKQHYKTFDPIQHFEEDFYLKCNRGGVMYGDIGVYDCWTYDFKFFYPSIMASKDYHIPTKIGTISTIESIPKKFKFGIYNIQIISNDVKFNKVFSFSKDNHYTHYSLNFVLYYNKKFNGDIQMTLLSSKALIYDETTLTTGYDLFYCWYNRIIELKAEFPSNKLVKKLGSTSWGELQTYKTIVKTEKEIINQNYKISFGFDKDYHIKKITQKSDTDIYHLVPVHSNLYEFPLRLKAFITDFGRVRIAKIALGNIDDVIRIQTDSITYSRNVKPNITNFVLEKDKTGTFEIVNQRIMKPVDI